MYEDLIKSLRTDHDKYFARDMEAADAIESLSKAYQMMAEAFESEVTKQKWISVTDRFPEEDVPVLVYLFDDSPYIAWINHENEWETEEFTIDHDYGERVMKPIDKLMERYAKYADRVHFTVGEKPKTNADRIRSMTDEELVEIIRCPIESLPIEYCPNMDCDDCILNWLKQEVTE